MTITTEDITIPAHDGGVFGAYVARPENCDKNNPAPAILVIQEIFGINFDMRKKCDELASKGYVAICPDLFWRIAPAGIQLVDSDPDQLQQAFDLFGKFDVALGIEDLKTTLGYIRHHKTCNKKVGTLGYCLGGKLAYMMACKSDVDAAVSYYGVAIETMLEDAAKIEKPLMLHIAEEDEFVSKETQTQIKSALEPHPLITIHSYEGANHAFARIDGMHYKEDAATQANARTDKFLKENLG